MTLPELSAAARAESRRLRLGLAAMRAEQRRLTDRLRATLASLRAMHAIYRAGPLGLEPSGLGMVPWGWSG